MVFIRYKKFGQQEYAYEITAYWNPKTKRPCQKTRYLGVVVDKKNKVFEKRSSKAKPEKLILDFGDAYLFDTFIGKSWLAPLLSGAVGGSTETLLALVSYKLCHCSAMRYAEQWFEGSYAKVLYKEANVCSQRISDFLEHIGDESMQRRFFSGYITKISGAKKGIVIDATSLPNQIHMPQTAWGLSGEEIDKQIRFLLVVDKDSSMPLFFRSLPGNIVDVSALRATLDELRHFGVKESYAYLDAGFFSEDNIKEMYRHNVQFLTRLPAIRQLYKELIGSEVDGLEAVRNVVRYGERVLFVKEKKIDLFGNEAYAYVVLDPERKGREIRKLMSQSIDEKVSNEDLEYEFSKRGVMILVSSSQISRHDAVPAYYIRQTAETMFGFSKDDLGILPLRVHKEETLRGLLFLQFVSLIAFMQFKNALGKKHTVEDALLTMRNLKCKVYDNEIIVSEMTRKQKEISESLGIIMPKTLGV